MKKWLMMPLLILVVLGVMSCGNTLVPSTKGSLSINIGAAMARTLLPDISMDISSFEISGTGPSGSSFNETVYATGTTTVTNLLVGQWTVRIDAYNSSAQKIGSVSKTATVTPNASTQVSMIVVPLTGNGTFQYTLTWPDEVALTSPSVAGAIYELETEPVPVTFELDGNSATYSADLPAGYYAFGLALLDGETIVWSSNPVAFRIVEGATTSGSTDLTGNEIAMYGNLDIDVGVDLQNPIDIALVGSATSITTAGSLNVDATISGTPDFIEWFLDGQWVSELDDLDSVNVGTGLGVGRHCLSILVLEGTTIGSEDYWFDVTQAEQANGIAEDFEDGLAQGWTLDDNWSIANGVLNSVPTYTEAWKNGYFSDSTFGGALEYRATFNASYAPYPYYTKGIAIGSTNPAVDGTTDGLYFAMAGNGNDYYSYWIGKGDGLGDMEWWTGWIDYASLPTTVIMKIVSDGAGTFYFYMNDDLVYTTTDTSIGTGYVGLFYYDGDDGYGNGNVFDVDNVNLSYVPVTSKFPALSFFKQPQAVKAGADLTKRVK
ncbi:MAG: hypothetical protein WC820_00905 [Spirochaetales bacterium]|jgi:hypothetical protein